MAKASETCDARAQNLLAAKDIAADNGDNATVTAIAQQITDLGYT